MSGYTVIDLETTGLFPKKHDRVVEIAMVFVSDTGEVQGSWSTLINPGRDVGPTHIHGITAREVLRAPTFQQLAPLIIRSIAGRTVVAHNARFDLGFLDYEFDRSQAGTVPPSPGLCTMQWSSHFLSGASRKLRDCCAAAGVSHHDEHSALGDATATSGLLRYYLQRAETPLPWSRLSTSSRSHRWPVVPDPLPEVSFVQRSSSPPRPDAWLDRISSHLPRNDDPLVDAYLDVLEKAMLDRYLSAHEEAELIAVATSLGLARDQLSALHASYLDSLAAAALEDGVVTAAEREELDAVAAMLGLPRRLVDIALRRTTPRLSGPTSSGSLALQHGDRVVFTGTLSTPRQDWEARAAGAGLICGGVTRDTRVVVAADPDSQSGKAAKARSYNIPVVNETTFSRMLDAMNGVS
ncbi:exonuclease domain-containing protein [Marmoricola endophyticus]|uniref:exonuclease domain-containing protein n=1 Tax=Marmoricola endophyticus TaxID=2040280 RepID=UPI001668A5A5|nr:exonuclease domain-containing protein [Marmoricola endophyticus]